MLTETSTDRAVAPAPPRLERPDAPAALQHVEDRVLLRRVDQQHLDVAADGLLGRPAVQPLAAAFQLVIVPSRSFVRIASSEDATTADQRSAIAWPSSRVRASSATTPSLSCPSSWFRARGRRTQCPTNDRASIARNHSPKLNRSRFIFRSKCLFHTVSSTTPRDGASARRTAPDAARPRCHPWPSTSLRATTRRSRARTRSDHGRDSINVGIRTHTSKRSARVGLEVRRCCRGDPDPACDALRAQSYEPRGVVRQVGRIGDKSAGCGMGRR